MDRIGSYLPTVQRPQWATSTLGGRISLDTRDRIIRTISAAILIGVGIKALRSVPWNSVVDVAIAGPTVGLLGVTLIYTGGALLVLGLRGQRRHEPVEVPPATAVAEAKPAEAPETEPVSVSAAVAPVTYPRRDYATISIASLSTVDEPTYPVAAGPRASPDQIIDEVRPSEFWYNTLGLDVAKDAIRALLGIPTVEQLKAIANEIELNNLQVIERVVFKATGGYLRVDAQDERRLVYDEAAGPITEKTIISVAQIIAAYRKDPSTEVTNDNLRVLTNFVRVLAETAEADSYEQEMLQALHRECVIEVERRDGTPVTE